MSAISQMLEEIQRDVELTQQYTGRSTLDPKILEVMRQVPRHKFVPELPKALAYLNQPASIGYGQTISQPYIVALMTDLLAPSKEDCILEIGTGSGYQTAILSLLVRKVYSLEIVEELGLQAKERLHTLGYDNVSIEIDNGYYGWKQHAPFDGIIVTAAATHIPPSLIEQLKPNGKLVIPVGSAHFSQELLFVTKSSTGEISIKNILSVVFVPLTGGPA